MASGDLLALTFQCRHRRGHRQGIRRPRRGRPLECAGGGMCSSGPVSGWVNRLRGQSLRPRWAVRAAGGSGLLEALRWLCCERKHIPAAVLGARAQRSCCCCCERPAGLSCATAQNGRAMPCPGSRRPCSPRGSRPGRPGGIPQSPGLLACSGCARRPDLLDGGPDDRQGVTLDHDAGEASSGQASAWLRGRMSAWCRRGRWSTIGPPGSGRRAAGPDGVAGRPCGMRVEGFAGPVGGEAGSRAGYRSGRPSRLFGRPDRPRRRSGPAAGTSLSGGRGARRCGAAMLRRCRNQV